MNPRRPRAPLSDADRALWDQVTSGIRPLRIPAPRKSRRPAGDAGPSSPVTLEPVMPEPSPPAALARPTPRPVSKSANSPALAPMERRTRLRLARGTAEIDERIDLHGLTQQEAHARLVRFLGAAQARGDRIVLVITGKGGGPRGGAAWGEERGVLRRQLPLWLQLPELRSLVVGYETAHVTHGGDGAFYVRVRRRRDHGVSS